MPPLWSPTGTPVTPASRPQLIADVIARPTANRFHIRHSRAVPRQKYADSIHKTVRRKTRTVMIGDVAVGSEHPIRVQTMTTTDTKDVDATVDQVRLTLPCHITNHDRERVSPRPVIIIAGYRQTGPA